MLAVEPDAPSWGLMLYPGHGHGHGADQEHPDDVHQVEALLQGDDFPHGSSS
jgi:hypothetical protein